MFYDNCVHVSVFAGIFLVLALVNTRNLHGYYIARVIQQP